MRTRIRSGISSLLGLVAVLLATTTAHASGKTTEAHTVPFVRVAKEAVPDRDWQNKICQLVSADCGATDAQSSASEQPALYRTKDDALGNYYAILPGPQLLKVSFASASGWKVLQRWDFSDYKPADRVDGDGDAPPLEIYPALYPLGGKRFAVAVLAGWHEMYSGGGGSWENADFVELQQDGGHASTPHVSELPFSCSKSLRACFSEHDYKHSPHCSEDFAGSLQLNFALSPTTGQLDWIATWKESHWPGMVPKSKTEHTSVSVTLPAGQNPVTAGASWRDKVPFCEPQN